MRTKAQENISARIDYEDILWDLINNTNHDEWLKYGDFYDALGDQGQGADPMDMHAEACNVFLHMRDHGWIELKDNHPQTADTMEIRLTQKGRSYFKDERFEKKKNRKRIVVQAIKIVGNAFEAFAELFDI